MSHVGTGYDINQTFVVEPLDNNIPILSACTALYTNNILSCSGDTQIFLGNGVITFDGNLYTSNDLTANTINASTYYSGGTNLIDIINLKNITGGTFNNTTDTLTLYKQNNSTVVVTGFTDYYTTGATLIGNTVYFNRNYVLSAYTLNLSNFSADTYVTGGTYSSGSAIFTNNTGGTFSVTGFSTGGVFTGGTVNGATLFTGGLSANTFSASTYYGNGINLTGVAHAFTGTTTLDFGSPISGESSCCTTTVANTNINQFSTVMIRFTSSVNHPDVNDSIIEELTVNQSDIIDGVSFNINAYAGGGTWGVYNVIYRIIN
jgi:hypothetical protein